MSHFSQLCMHMAAHTYANETGQTFRQKFEFHDFLYVLLRNIFRLKLLYIVTKYTLKEYIW